jgi:uncharacterized protein YhaN
MVECCRLAVAEAKESEANAVAASLRSKVDTLVEEKAALEVRLRDSDERIATTQAEVAEFRHALLGLQKGELLLRSKGHR